MMTKTTHRQEIMSLTLQRGTRIFEFLLIRFVYNKKIDPQVNGDRSVSSVVAMLIIIRYGVKCKVDFDPVAVIDSRFYDPDSVFSIGFTVNIFVEAFNILATFAYPDSWPICDKIYHIIYDEKIIELSILLIVFSHPQCEIDADVFSLFLILCNGCKPTVEKIVFLILASRIFIQKIF